MPTRSTKFRASISKSHIPIDEIGSHFDTQRQALQSVYDECSVCLTETDDAFTIHVQRGHSQKMSSTRVQAALDDNYGSPERYAQKTGVVIRQSGMLREHGGARIGMILGDASKGASKSGKKNDRYHEVKLCAIGGESCTLSLETLAKILSRGEFRDTIKCFGFHLQDVTLGNHNFSCNPKIALAKYLPTGAPYFISDYKNVVCRKVCGNWVERLGSLIDENQGALDESAVTNFRRQRQNYQDLVVTDSSAVDEYEKQIVQAVSEMAKTKRDLYEYNCGKKIRFVF